MTTYGCFNICLSKTILSITIHTIAYVAAVLFSVANMGWFAHSDAEKILYYNRASHFVETFYASRVYLQVVQVILQKSHQIQDIMRAKKFMLSVPYYAVLLGSLWRGRSEQCFFNM